MGWPRTTDIFPEPTWWNGGPDDDPGAQPQHERDEWCPDCEGTGDEMVSHPFPDDPYFRHHTGKPCKSCDGSGKGEPR